MGGESDASPPPIRIALFTVMGVAVKTAVQKVIDLRGDLELALVVTCPGPRSRRSNSHLEVLEALWEAGHHNTDVVVCNHKSRYADLMVLYEIDMILSMGYPWLLPAEILSPGKHPASPRLGALNIHNSLLPEYRGPNAFGWAIVNGDPEFGFCAHRMDGTFDTGPVLLTWTVPDEDINRPVFELLGPRLATVFPEMIGRAIDKMLDGDPGTPQAGGGSHAPKFGDAFRWIDGGSSTALEVHRTVRAFYGGRDLPLGALASVGGTPIRVTRTFYRDPAGEPAAGREAGTAVVVVATDPARPQSAKGGPPELPPTFFLRCKDTTLEVLEWTWHTDADADTDTETDTDKGTET